MYVLCYKTMLLAQRCVEANHKSLVLQFTGKKDKEASSPRTEWGEACQGEACSQCTEGPHAGSWPRPGTWRVGVHGEEGDKEGVPGSDSSDRPACVHLGTRGRVQPSPGALHLSVSIATFASGARK